MKPTTFILTAPGTNCEKETRDAVEFAGGQADIVLLDDWRQGDVSLDNYQSMIVPGGFSYGDDIASGRVVGTELRSRFADQVNRFVEAGKAVVGICNGLQILVESGLLPDGSVQDEREKTLSMINNANNRFEWGWGRLLVQPSVCRFIPKDMEGSVVSLPYAHQEGRVAVSDPTQLDEMAAAGQIVFSYVGTDNQPTEEHPANPNGSPRGITGFCDKTGVVLGLMPHPERAMLPHQLSNYRRGENQPPFGAILLESFVDYAKQM